MALPPQVFRFHDIASVQVDSPAPFARDFFEAEYGYHQASADPQGLPRVALTLQMDGRAPAGFTRHAHKLLARWSYRIDIQPGEIALGAHANQAAVPMIHHMLVHPSLRWLAAGGGTLLLHAGAVVKNNKSLIFTGTGGTGKTTTTSLVLASIQGWQIHADDYVFLRPEQSLAYVTRSHLYRDLQKWVPALRHRLTPGERLRLEFFGALRENSREGIKWPVRLGPARMWPGLSIANTAVPAGILLLERADIPEPELRPLENPADASHDLLEMNFGEARHFLSLLEKAGTLEKPWLSAWKETEHRLLDGLLSKIPAYHLALPVSGKTALDSEHTQARLLELLDELVK